MDETRGIEIDEDDCIECGSAGVQVYCYNCEDNFCVLCYQSQHRKGKRKDHKIKAMSEGVLQYLADMNSKEWKISSEEKMGEDGSILEKALVGEGVLDVGSPEWYLNRSKYIPLRLSYEERKILRMMMSALNVSDYTSIIDGREYKDENYRTMAKVKEIQAFLQGLATACNYEVGQKIMAGDSRLADHQNFFRKIIELCRRYKILNPEKMRGEYGKFLYILQDCVANTGDGHVKESLEFNCVKPINTVYAFLEKHDRLDLLQDKLVPVATNEVMDDKSKSRSQIQKEINLKNKAIEKLSRDYQTRGLSSDDIKNCLYSIGDNYSFLSTNMVPVDKMISYLKDYFNPEKYEEGYTLAISAGGDDGARLSHTHEKQYAYVLQSLLLWRDIAFDMFRLWQIAEDDLLNPDNKYELKNTGQGIHRVQQSQGVAKIMRELIHNMQAKTAYSWVGSSVVHLGDHNVPNAFLFIEKYTQVSRILTPLVGCLERIEELMKNDLVKDYVESKWESSKNLKRDILVDFFRHAFDGSGADNFYDAGSCIDGRLTSAWNWCSNLDSKPFFPIFLLNGFVGFDGSFQD